ncbi:hypothetical protein ABW20_dc0103831 [Dactylellina cionopaga]|nr:hypothetical protein ABW20_dc0103831 [Dactylellina cionopaga]
MKSLVSYNLAKRPTCHAVKLVNVFTTKRHSSEQSQSRATLSRDKPAGNNRRANITYDRSGGYYNRSNDNSNRSFSRENGTGGRPRRDGDDRPKRQAFMNVVNLDRTAETIYRSPLFSPGWDPSKGHVRKQDLRGTISINPNETCKSASFDSILAACERGLDAVVYTTHKNPKMEEMMRPSNVWRYYDWRRRLLLKRYTDLGYGLSVGGDSTLKFKDAVKELRAGNMRPGIGGRVGENGEYLMEMEGQTFDIAPLKMNTMGGSRMARTSTELGLPEQTEVDDDAEVRELYGEPDDADISSGISSGDLDWGLDDFGANDVEGGHDEKTPERKQTKHGNKGRTAISAIQYNDGF